MKRSKTVNDILSSKGLGKKSIAALTVAATATVAAGSAAAGSALGRIGGRSATMLVGGYSPSKYKDKKGG